ncbi:metallophosphoesterase family protein [Butyrivibrio sp. MB2005]|uniref:metallophosphoesterase family protein n=1 Tax=Butyrivibrio sp. MB2005 TaxID=1280678 RepID=UPI00040C8470|nr:metallophosphoesterase family protein [Butyrivibrio sp. MB2005]
MPQSGITETLSDAELVKVVHNVKYEEDYGTLKKAAIARNADIVLFGHTHYAEIRKDKETGIVLVNPGTICYPQFSSDKGNRSTIVHRLRKRRIL